MRRSVGCLVTDPNNPPLSRPGVYRLTHVATGRRYVGATRNMRRRFREFSWGNGNVQQVDELAAPCAFLAEPLYYTLDVRCGRRGHLTEVENALIAEQGDLNRPLRIDQMFAPAVLDELRSRRASAEHKALRAEQMNERYADPAYRAKHHASTTRANKNPARNINLSRIKTGTRYITDGSATRVIRPDLELLPDGWRFGRHW